MDLDVTDNAGKRKNVTECVCCRECVRNCPKGGTVTPAEAEEYLLEIGLSADEIAQIRTNLGE